MIFLDRLIGKYYTYAVGFRIMKKDFDITKAKLVIWDLDETFWDGTLTEGGIKFKPENLKLVQELVTKGIMNSICSKNSMLDARNQFITNGYLKFWQLFVFPSIDWTPKGQRVKNIISSMNLREENVIMIDDNESNINEIKYYCPNIMSALPEQISKIAEELYLVNDYDFEHTRLRQYKMLEAKNKDKLKTNCSNEDFLRSSEIKICIKKDCSQNIDRIDKLIHRTNQLNFTKQRTSKEDLQKYFADTEKFDSAYIIAEDKYGNYGICGFYVLNKELNALEHFLFSCRIMNMGIEQFVYNYLKKPKINIVPPVSAFLGADSDWIKIIDNIELKPKEVKKDAGINILFKGACDLYSVISYISGDCNIDTEFPYWNKQLVYILSHTHTAFIEQTNRLSQERLLELCKSFPFPNPDEFKTRFFDSKYDVIVLSLLTTTYRGLYINKADGTYAEYGYANCDITDENNWDKVLASIPENMKEANRAILRDFRDKYIFAGDPPVDLVLKNLEYIRNTLKPQTQLILILGSEKPTDKFLEGYEGMASKHIILNKAVREFVQKYDNIDILELTDLIQSDDDYNECINHFSRRVYADFAGKIVGMVNKKLGKNLLELNL